MVSKSSREIAGKMHKLEEQSSTKGTTVSQGESHTEPLTRQGPEQRTGRALPSVLYSNTAEAHPFSFRRKTLAPRYKTMRGASPVPAGLLVDPGDMSQGECGTCQVYNAETGTDAAEVSVQDADSHTCSLTLNWGSALTQGSSRMWDSCVLWKKRCFCLQGRLQCCKIIATAREGNAFPETYGELILFLFHWSHQSQCQDLAGWQFQKELWCYVSTNSWIFFFSQPVGKVTESLFSSRKHMETPQNVQSVARPTERNL